MRKIYIRGPKPRSMGILIKRFLGGDTIGPTSSHVFGVQSFSNEQCTINQCVSGKMRSFDDIFGCVKTYFKSATEKKVLQEILKLNMSHGTIQFHPAFGFCSGMRKIKILYYRNNSATFSNLDTRGRSPKSWNQLFLTLGLDGQGQVRDYIIANRNKK